MQTKVNPLSEEIAAMVKGLPPKPTNSKQSDPDRDLQLGAIAHALGLTNSPKVFCEPGHPNMPARNDLLDILDAYYPGWRGYQVPKAEEYARRKLCLDESPKCP